MATDTRTVPLAPPRRHDEAQTPLEQFVGANTAYYASHFARLTEGGLTVHRVNWAALALGPLWAAARGLWSLAWYSIAGETVGLLILVYGLWGPRGYGEAASVRGGVVTTGLLIFLATKCAIGLLANWAYHRRFIRWRLNQNMRTGCSPQAAMACGAAMLVIYPLMLYRASTQDTAGFLLSFPTSRTIAQRTADSIDYAVDWLTINFVALFDAITTGVRVILNFLELVFIGIPWPVMALVLLLIAWRVAGRKVAIFTACALAYLGLFGFWDKSMSTIALVGASVFICFVLGAPLGIWCAKSARAHALIKPLLDFMQTMPSFVYLVPAIAFFSIGKPPGVLATVIFAMPPMIRLTTLGIQQVPNEVKEAALAFGASPRQLLFKVELPLAIPAIMTGINQTIMMSLSMVVIAALIGAGGLGYDVLFALQHVEAGKGILAGIAIALCAMIMDRIIQGAQHHEGHL
jgi:glycine betaine/proline transport system permease protein